MNRDVLERLRSNPRARAPGHEQPTRPQPARRRRRRFPFLPLLLIFGFIALALAGWTAASNPALASILTLAMVTPTQAARPFWARAGLAKPAYTPTPILLPTATQPAPALADAAPSPTEAAPTEMPPLISAVIVEDPSIPDSQADQEPAPSVAYSGSKYILVDISEQHLYAYENGDVIYSFVASTGLNNATATGNFAVQSKIPNAYGSTWNIWMPNWLGIYWSGGLENGIHALPILPNGGILWEGFLGRPISYGCVVLGTYESQLLYDWAEYGTPVDIQW